MATRSGRPDSVDRSPGVEPDDAALAGEALSFTGSFLAVREATAEELDHGHVHGEGGHHHDH